MPIFNILNADERKRFDDLPEFNSFQRKQYFRVNSEIQEIVDSLRSATTKVIFVLMLGYFKSSKQFFGINFSQTDIDFVCSKLDLDQSKIELSTYSRQKYAYHKNIILSILGWNPFKDEALETLRTEVQFLLRSQTRHRQIFDLLVQKLKQDKIEIPSYNTLANLISQESKIYDSKINNILVNCLDKDVILELNTLLQKSVADEQVAEPNLNELDNTPYVLTNLKRFHQSNRPTKIRQNLEALTRLQKLFVMLEPARKQIDFTDEGIKYYASLTIKQELFQISRRKEPERLIYFYCFVINQYQKLQDLLVDTIQFTVQSYLNQAKKAMDLNFLENRSNTEKLISLAKNRTKYHLHSFREIKNILQDPILSPEEKINKLNLYIAQTEKTLEPESELEKIDESEIKDESYFLENLSRRISQRLGGIIFQLDFDRDEQSNDPNLLTVIDYYCANKGEIGIKPPVDFLNTSDVKMLKVNSKQFRRGLYKVFLFREIARQLKAGTLNLKHSFRFRSAQDSLIKLDDFETNQQNYLKLASLEDKEDVSLILGNMQDRLENSYYETNHNISLGQNKLLKFDSVNLGRFTLATPAIPESSTKLSDLLPRDKYISLTEIMHTIARNTGFCELFENLQNTPSRPRPSRQVLLAAIFGGGCNLGLHRMSQITKIKESDLEYASNWFLTSTNLKLANEKVVETITKLDLPNIYKQNQDKLFTSSDGQKVVNNQDSFIPPPLKTSDNLT